MPQCVVASCHISDVDNSGIADNVIILQVSLDYINTVSPVFLHPPCHQSPQHASPISQSCCWLHLSENFIGKQASISQPPQTAVKIFWKKYSINHKSPNPHIHPHIVPPHYHYHHLITTLSLAVSNCDGASVVFLVLESVCVCECAFRYFLSEDGALFGVMACLRHI